MTAIGNIKLILNKEYLLVTTTNYSSLTTNTVLVVYDEVISEEVEKEAGIKNIYFPKGKLVVIAKQAENLYLVSTVKTQEIKRKRTINPRLSSVISSWGMLMGNPEIEEEIIESVPLKYPSKVDEKASLNISFSTLIKVGDKVGLEE